MQEETSTNFDINRYKALLWRKRYLALSVALGVLSLMTWGSFLMPKVYEASATIMIERNALSNPLAQGASARVTEELLRKIRNTVTSREVIKNVCKALGMKTPDMSETQFESLITRQQKKVNISTRNASDPDSFTISYQGMDPVMVKAFVDTLLVEFTKKSELDQRSAAEGTFEFINSQLEEYKIKLRETDMAALQLREKHPALVSHNEANAPEVRLQQLNQQLMLLLNRYTEDYPEVIRLKSEIVELKNQIAQSTKSAVKTPVPSSAGNETGPQYSGYQEEWSKIQRERVAYQRLYDELIQRRELSRVSKNFENADKADMVRIVEPPFLPLFPVSPDKIKIILLGLFLGIAAGVGSVVGLDYFDQSFKDEGALQKKLRLPVLASVPTIIKEADILAESRLDRKVFSITVAYLAVIGLVLLAEVLYRYMGISVFRT